MMITNVASQYQIVKNVQIYAFNTCQKNNKRILKRTIKITLVIIDVTKKIKYI